MAVPDYQSLMGPALAVLADGEARTTRELRERVGNAIGLTQEDRRALIPSGSPVFNSRLHWATTYMAQAGLLHRPKRGVLQITPLGAKAFAERGESIDNSYLSEFPEFRDFQTRARESQSPRSGSTTLRTEHASTEDSITPTESIEAAVEQANAGVD